MSERIIVFEGFADTESGWDFDMPVYMIRPVRCMGEGGNVNHAETMVEDYLVDMGMGKALESEDGEWRPIMQQFYRARSGKSRTGKLVYWRQEVRIHGEIPNEEFSNVMHGPMHHGPLAAPTHTGEAPRTIAEALGGYVEETPDSRRAAGEVFKASISHPSGET